MPMTPVPVAIKSQAEDVTRKLLAYCQASDWAGYDPYDALNSRIFTALPALNSRIPRLVLTQTLKRCPVNIRRLMLVAKTQNPKALALNLTALLKLASVGMGNEALVESMVQRLIAQRSPHVPYWCWGYSFPWQTRTIVVPARAPNLVCTTFVAAALVDAYEMRQDVRCMRLALSAAEYIAKELYWSDGHGGSGFSYPQPGVQSRVHNANLLAAALLCRIHKLTGRKEFLRPALTVARYSSSKQRADGSWSYGELPTQQWNDNFHTGYNLCALQSIAQDTQMPEFEACLRPGFEFYRDHFFRPDGAAKYFHDRVYPIDIHCAAQSIITLLAFRELDPQSAPLAQSVFRWAVKHLWDPKGFFYYQVRRLYTIRIPYMRWSQAWALLALATLLVESRSTGRTSSTPSTVGIEA
jgi:hypothetical protein